MCRDSGKDKLMKEVWHLFLVDPKHYASYIADEEKESARAYLGCPI